MTDRVVDGGRIEVASVPGGVSSEPDAGASLALFQRLERSMPGANTRTTTYYQPYPVALDRGQGPYVWDVDGNRLIDLVNNYTSLVHGHAAPEVTEAITREATRGTVFPAPIELQAELSERLCERIASVELIRFTNSGTEAGMHAVRCARAATARPLIVKAELGYHGSWDGLPSSSSATSGIPEGVLGDLRWIEYNSIADLERVMAATGGEVAAIVLEPVLGCAVIPADPAFLQAARRLADEAGALLILDEVVTMRLEFNGYQRALGVEADLTTFGKLIGGGLPVGAFGGRADLMKLYDPRLRGGVEHHGTFNGNSVTMAAGVVSMDLLSAAEIARINGLGASLAQGLRDSLAKHSLDAEITEAGSLVQVHFGAEGVPKTGGEVRSAAPELAAFHRAALDRGVYIAPRGELNITTAMDATVVSAALERLDAALGTLAVAVV